MKPFRHAAIAVVLLVAHPASGVMVTWVGTNGASATTNWSDVNNWDQINTFTHIAPANNAVNFTWITAASVSGKITVNVDGAYGTPGTGLAQSYGAFFGQTNGYHTVFIQPGITWALQAGAATPGVGMLVSPQPTNNNTISVVNTPNIPYTNWTTIFGLGGTLFMDGLGLRVEGGSTVGGNHYSILDMSGLGTLVMTNNRQGSSGNISSNSFFVVNGAANSQALVYLARTNVITLIDDFRVGYLGNSSNTLPIGVYLGQSNYISTGPSNNNLVLGGPGCTGSFMRFNPTLLGGPAMPVANFTGSGGSQNVTICSAVGGTVPGYAICDLTGGNVAWSINALSLGIGSNAISANGVLMFDNGAITADSVLAGGPSGAGSVAIGANALLTVNGPVALGSGAGGSGILNISGGTLAANSVSTSGGLGTVNMTNGQWNVAITSSMATNMVVTSFNGFGPTNKINITALPPFLPNGAGVRFHLIAANVAGASTLGIGLLPGPYSGYLDASTTPGLVDLVLTGGALVAGTDVLANPGFEVDPIGENNVVYGWNIYSGGGNNVLNESSSTLGNDGNNFLKVFSGFTGGTNYNGIYQDYISGPGTSYAAGGWAFSSATDLIAGQNAAWLEITFRDQIGTVLALYRSAMVTASSSVAKNAWAQLLVTNQYNPNTLQITNYVNTLTAPPGTRYVRFQVVFQGDPANSPGSVYFDDLALTQTGGGPYGNWNIVWSDEFNGTSLSNIWSYDTGGGGWGDDELEYYTSLAQNVYLSNGVLHMVGLNQSYNAYNYTSGRIKTLGKYFFQYGRIAFRLKVPPGVGLWPGLWMMPENAIYGPWAASGEIDVMESTGRAPQNVIGTIHYGGPYPATAQSGGPSYNYIPGTSLNNFDTYILDWSSNAFNWYINGWLYETQTNWWSSSTTNTSIRNPYPAPFNEPFYLLINLAIGGAYGGPTVDNNAFPADMQIDYVRLYNLTDPLQIGASMNGTKMQLTWPSNIVCRLQATTNLANATSWTNVPNATPPFLVKPAVSTFYRLLSP